MTRDKQLKTLAKLAVTPTVATAPADVTAPAAAVDPEEARRNSRITLSSHSSAAFVAEAYGTQPNVDLLELQEQLRQQCIKVKDGDLDRAGSMLISQAQSLDVIFNRLALDAHANLYRNGGLDHAERFLRLALKAQNQCRNTLATLVEIKSPRVFAPQTNIAHGPQQVNNNPAPTLSVKQIENRQTELLEHDHGQRLDTATATTTGRRHKALATVEAIDRPAHAARKGRRKP